LLTKIEIKKSGPFFLFFFFFFFFFSSFFLSVSMVDSILLAMNHNHTTARHYNTNFLLSPSSSSSIVKEEISTIFVVGFPENMQEREFQNMFIFCPGFEAATLKLPNNTQHHASIDEEEDGNRKQIVRLLVYL
jgi:hypothetical protein